MGIISLFFIVIFTLLYLSKSIERKPDFLVRLLGMIEDNIDNVSFWGFVWGLAAFILAPVTVRFSNVDLLVRLGANLVIVLMTLPIALNGLQQKARINETLARELRNLVGFVARHEKIVGFVGAGFSLLLFATLSS